MRLINTTNPLPLKNIILFNLAKDFLLHADKEKLIPFATGQPEHTNPCLRELSQSINVCLDAQIKKRAPKHVLTAYRKFHNIPKLNALFFNTIVTLAYNFETKTFLQQVYGDTETFKKSIADLLDGKHPDALNSVFFQLCFLNRLKQLDSFILQLKQYKISIKDMLKNDNYRCFRIAAGNGHLIMLNRLVELANKEDDINIKDVLSGAVLWNSPWGGQRRCYKYGVFLDAAAGGHLNTLNRVVELANKEDDISIKDMLSVHDTWGGYSAFLGAAAGGHLNTLNRVVELASKEDDISIKDMLKEKKYYAFRIAARNGHPTTAKRIVELASNEGGINISGR